MWLALIVGFLLLSIAGVAIKMRDDDAARARRAGSERDNGRAAKDPATNACAACGEPLPGLEALACAKCHAPTPMLLRASRGAIGALSVLALAIALLGSLVIRARPLAVAQHLTIAVDLIDALQLDRSARLWWLALGVGAMLLLPILSRLVATMMAMGGARSSTRGM